MKLLPLYFLAPLLLSSCRTPMQWPWQKPAVNADPYATNASAGAGGYQAYPGAATPAANQNYAYPNYSTAGEQAQVTPANAGAAAPQDSSTGQEGWSTSGAMKAGGKKKAAATPKSAPMKVASGNATYVVQKRDTLYGISQKTGTTVSKLMALNGLKSTNIGAGQRLRLR